MHVDAGNIERQRICACDLQCSPQLWFGHAEFAGGAVVLHVSHGTAFSTRIQPQVHLSLPTKLFSNFSDALQFEGRLDIDRLDTATDRRVQFLDRLGNAVENNVFRREPNGERLPKLAARIDLDAKALAADDS